MSRLERMDVLNARFASLAQISAGRRLDYEGTGHGVRRLNEDRFGVSRNFGRDCVPDGGISGTDARGIKASRPPAAAALEEPAARVGYRMHRPSWVPAEVDLSRPSAARVYDYYLGGSHNLEVDRRMAREAISLWPDLPEIMRSNRAFLRRSVRYLAGQGIAQFLDIGSGIPTVGNVHEAAQQADPRARVVYVDSDSVAVAHSRAILAGDAHTTVVHGDLREPEAILEDPAVRATLDLDQPIAVLMVAVLHFVSDEDDPFGAVARIRDRLTAGSHLALSHASAEGRPEAAASHRELYSRTPTPMTMRSRDAIAQFFDGFDLVDPGLVWLPLWRPDDPSATVARPERTTGFAGVGRRR